MIINERHQRIMEIVKKEKHISTKKLVSLLFISEATLRRDLVRMEKDGLIKRSFGGVSLPDPLTDLSIHVRSQENITEKRKIAVKCLDIIKENSTYFIDSSSTVGVLLDYFDRFENITIVTNGIDNAKILANNKMPNIYMAPGMVNYRTNSIIGSDAISYVNSFNCQYAIISCSGINLNGPNEANFEQTLIKKAMLKNASIIILLVDSSKFDKIFLSKISSFEDIDYIITDKLPPQEYIEAFEDSNTKLIVA